LASTLQRPMKKTNKDFAKVVKILAEKDSFVLFCHTSPDGDTFGSASALAQALTALGKKVGLACDMEVPHTLRDLPFKERFRTVPDVKVPYVSVAVDCGDEGRLGKLLPEFLRGEPKISIDHHLTNQGFGDLNVVDPKAPATICLVWPIIKALGVKPDAGMGLAAYIALATDTGNFSYGNTTAEAFSLAAELLVTGFDITAASERLFRERTAAQTHVLGICAERMQLFCNGRIAVSGMTAEDFNRIGAVDSDCEGAAGFLRDIDTVEASAFVRETAPGRFKVSLRSKNALDVSKIACRYGGGGHCNAAGCCVLGTLASAMDQTAEELKKAMSGE